MNDYDPVPDSDGLIVAILFLALLIILMILGRIFL